MDPSVRSFRSPGEQAPHPGQYRFPVLSGKPLQAGQVLVREPDVRTPVLTAVIVYLIRQYPFYGGLIGPPHHGEGEQCLGPFRSEYRFQGRNLILQKMLKERVKAEGFNIDAEERERGLSEGVFRGGDKSVMFGDFSY
jgi:hypothetical protein